MFVYCLNNPACYIDISGALSTLLTDKQAVALNETPTEATEGSSSDTNPKNTPPNHPNYTPPKKGPQKKKNPNGNGWGWVDKEGNVWVWTPNMHGGPGWVVQEPDGGHKHAYPGGYVRTHCESILHHGMIEIFPTASATAHSTLVSQTVSIAFIGGCGAFLVLMVACDFLTGSWGGVR